MPSPATRCSESQDCPCGFTCDEVLLYCYRHPALPGRACDAGAPEIGILDSGPPDVLTASDRSPEERPRDGEAEGREDGGSPERAGDTPASDAVLDEALPDLPLDSSRGDRSLDASAPDLGAADQQAAKPAAEGILDLSLAGCGYVSYTSPHRSTGNGVTVDEQGRVVVVGEHNGIYREDGIVDCALCDTAVWRFLEDGQPDASFGVDGYAFETAANHNRGYDIVIRQDQILVGGYRDTGTDNPTIWAWTEDGLLDQRFSTDGIAFVPVGGEVQGFAISEGAADTIYITGGQNDNFLVLARVSVEGAIDSNFGNNGRVLFSDPFWGAVGKDVAVDSQQRVVVAGAVKASSSTTVHTPAVWRYQPDGQPDLSLAGQGYLTPTVAGVAADADCYCRSLVLAPDDAIHLAITCASGQGSDLAVVRLAASDGAVDPGFASAGQLLIPAAGVNAIVQEPGGFLYVAGFAVNPGGDKDMCVWRLAPSGDVDPNFGVSGRTCHGDGRGAARDDQALAIAVDAHGRLVVAGESWGPADTAMTLWRFR